MNIDEAVYAHLIAFPGLSALINKRVYPIVMPINVVLPAVSVQRISTERVHAFQADTGLTSASVQVSIWAKTDTVKKGYSHTAAVSEQTRKALQNFSATMGGTGGVTVNAVLMDTEMTDYDETTQTYAVHQDFQIWYQEV